MKYFEKYNVRFEYLPGKNVWFCFISIVWFHFSHKTDKFYFKAHQNTLIFSDKKMMSDLIMSCQTVSDLV